MNKLKVAVLFSGGASALQYLSENDPYFGVNYEIVCGVSNKKGTKGEEFFRSKGLNFIQFNTKKYCEDEGYDGKLRDMPLSIREGYFSHLFEFIRPFEPDIIMLAGFMLEITKPLLGYRPILNVKAIEAGEKTTASTIHFVEEEIDCGKIIWISDPLVVPEGVDPKIHQDNMKIFCDGPAYKAALKILCDGIVV